MFLVAFCERTILQTLNKELLSRDYRSSFVASSFPPCSETYKARAKPALTVRTCWTFH